MAAWKRKSFATHSTFFLLKSFLLPPIPSSSAGFHYILRFACECFIFRRGTSHIAEEFSFFAILFSSCFRCVSLLPIRLHKRETSSSPCLCAVLEILVLPSWRNFASHFFASSSSQRFFLFNLISYCLRFANVNILYLRRPI